MTVKTFKNPSGQLYTRRLFYELATDVNDRSMTIYTLKDDDHLAQDGETYLSLYARYLDLADPTEFIFANTYFASYEHWRMICETEWFKAHVERYRRELELKLKSKYLVQVQRVAEDPQHKNSFEALKYLLSTGWKEKAKDKPTRGRPSKNEIAQHVHEIAKEDRSLKEDWTRIVGEG